MIHVQHITAPNVILKELQLFSIFARNGLLHHNVMALYRHQQTTFAVNSKRLKQNSMPYVFNFPNHLLSNKVKRKAPIARPSRPLIQVKDHKHDLLYPSPSKKQCMSKSPTKEELRMKLDKKKKVKVLQQKVRRKQKKISTLTILFSDLTKIK